MAEGEDQDLPAVREQQGRKGRGTLSTQGVLRPFFGDLPRFAESRPHVDLKTLGRGDFLAMRTKDNDLYGFLVLRSNVPGALGVEGALFLGEEKASQLGVPQVIGKAAISGARSAPGSSSLLGDRLVQGMGTYVRLPLSNLGPLFEKKERHIALRFGLAALEAVGVKKRETFVGTDQNKLRSLIQRGDQLRKPREAGLIKRKVDDWAGKGQGVGKESLEVGLYRDPVIAGGGVRTSYWISPKSGEVFKDGALVYPSVWEAARENSAAYVERRDADAEEAYFRLLDAAAFSYCGLKLGFRPPGDLMRNLEKSGLGFSLPREMR
jgi:hypothetical protein